MLLDQNKYNVDSDIEFLSERPVGWSSACLESAITYYLSYNNNDLLIEDNIKAEDDKS